MNEILLDFEVLPLYAQIEIGDRETDDLPDWESGEEQVVSTATTLYISTQPDSAGDVHVSVLAGSESADLGHEVFSGRLNLPSKVLAIGNSISAHLEEVDLSPAETVDVRVFVAPEVEPNMINVLLVPRNATCLAEANT